MKKLYLTSNLVKVVSLGAAMATLLSSVSPIFAANLAITGNVNLGTGAPGVLYPHGSHGSVVLAGDDNYCGADNVVGRGGKQQQSVAENRKITVEEQYRRFIENLAFNGYNPYGTTTQQAVWNGDSTTTQNSGYMGTLTGGIPNAMPEAFGVYSFATGCGSSATGNYSTAFGAGATAKAGGAQAFGVSALASGKASVAMGVGSEASGESTVALGGLATATGKESIAIGTKTKAKDSYAVAIGIEAEAKASGSIAIGSGSSKRSSGPNRKVIAEAENSIAIGTFTFAEKDDSVAIGANAQARVKDGVAIGGGSVSRVEKGVNGYDPVTGTISTEVSETWKSTAGAFSVGDTSKEVEGYKITRQITGVAAGTEDTDAVNVAQLKALKDIAAGGWKLSVNGSEATDVDPGSTVDFSVDNSNVEGAENLKIAKKANNNIKFALNENLKLTSVTTGRSTMSDDGFVIADGPRMTSDGIDGGNQKITGVEKGTDDNDAVNFAQLKEIKNEIAGNTLVKWQEDRQLITIGKEKGGTRIDIANQSGAERVISGVANGRISDSSKEAINGSQINKIAGDIANYFGGDAAFVDGAFAGPRYNLTFVGADGNTEQRNFNDVGSALRGLDGNVRNVNSRLTNVSNVLNQRIDNLSQDALLWSETEQAFVALHGNGGNSNSKITFLLDGEISADSTDAINGSQLFKIADNTSKFFGGSANVINGTEPAFLIEDKSYNNVTDAFIGVNTFINNINNKIIDMEKNDLVQQDALTNIITIGKKTAGTEISIAGYGNAPRTISGVSKAEKGDQAVNKDQLDESIEKISQNIEVATAAAVLYDKNEDGSVNYGSVTLGGKNNNNEPVALLNVKDGNISEDSHDAINGSQINTISKDIAKFLGGDTKFENGVFSAPTYTLSIITEDGQGGSAKVKYHDVGSALKGLDGNIQSVNNRLTNVVNEFTNQFDGFLNDALLWSEDEQAFVAKHGKNGEKTKSKLKFLLDGEIAKGSTDAITGNQLYLLNQTLATYFGGGAKYENGQWTAPTFKVSQFDVNGNTGEKKSYNNVAEAFDGVNNGMSNINNRINDVINKVESDALKWNEKENAYDAGRGGKPNKITNVADGKIAENSKDAVNGGQLWQTNERISGVEKDVKHLGDRVDNISGAIIDIGETVTNIENKVDGIAEDAVRYDRDENGKKINKITLKGGDASEPVMIDNVADGTIKTGSKEAINGGQLHDYTKEQMQIILDESKSYTDQRVNNIVIDAIDDAVERANNYTDMKFDALNYSIENVRKEAKQAAAVGLAVSNLRYNDMPGKLSIGFGSGLWRNQSAFAFGAGYTSEGGSVRSNVSVTTSGGHWGVGAGFNLLLN